MCGRVGQPGEAFCGGCGTSLGNGASHPHIPHQRTVLPQRAQERVEDTSSETTRLLCAAAHLDPDYADACIEEYLVEPHRAVARAPGVEASAVLGDAVAANTRRRIRDGLLVALVVLMLLTSWGSFLIWFLVAAAYQRFAHPRRPRRTARSALTLAAITAGLASIPVSFFVVLATYLYVAGGSSTPVIGYLLLVVVGLVGVPVVLLSEEFLTYRVVRSEFRRGRFEAHPTSSTLRNLGRLGAAERIARVRGAERFDPSSGMDVPDAEVVVFRGGSPFVGTGTLLKQRVPLLPLKQADESDRTPVELSAREVHASIRRGISAIARCSSLSPHGRLGEMQAHEQLLVDADHLVIHYPDDEARTFLPDRGRRPISRLSSGDAQALLRRPREWVRYYQLFQVEGWERDLTVSCHVAVGTDRGMLALEWALCVLPPVAPAYKQMTDDRRALTRYLLDRALTDLIVLPLSLMRRIRRVVRPFRAIPADPGELIGAKYGAGRSLRELGAAEPETYFHEVDIKRYVSVFDRAIFEAVRTHLRERGLSVASLDQAEATYNIVGSISGGAVAFGTGAMATAGPDAGAAPGAGTPTPGGTP